MNAEPSDARVRVGCIGTRVESIPRFVDRNAMHLSRLQRAVLLDLLSENIADAVCLVRV